MISIITEKLKKENILHLLNNFLSLSFLQMTNFLLPLVVIPHLVQKLEIVNFGLVSFSQVLLLYFVIFSEYGFNLSATKEVSVNRDNKEKLNEIFNSVISTRLLLSLVGFIILSGMVYLIPELKKDWQMYLLGSTMMFGQALIPVWFFLGIEKMRYITYLNLVSKIFFTLLTFVIVDAPEDYIYPNMLHGLGSMVAGIICFFIVAIKFKIYFKPASIEQIKTQLIDAFPIFISNFATNIYMNINIVILNFVSTPEIVGLYSIAEKVFIAGKHLISVVFQTVYPYACQLYKESTEKLKKFFSAFQFVLVLGFLGLGTFTFIFAEEIIHILSRKDLPYSIFILKLLSFIPLIIAVNIPAYQCTLIFNYKKSISFTMIIASVINVMLNVILGKAYGALGTVMAITATEIFVLVSLNLIMWKRAGLTFFRIPGYLSSQRG